MNPRDLGDQYRFLTFAEVAKEVNHVVDIGLEEEIKMPMIMMCGFNALDELLIISKPQYKYCASCIAKLEEIPKEK